jgi:hypothetical protein
MTNPTRYAYFAYIKDKTKILYLIDFIDFVMVYLHDLSKWHIFCCLISTS